MGDRGTKGSGKGADAAASGARAWIGTSGWHYRHWVGVLYPPGLDAKHWLEAYAQRFACVELNASFYRLPGENMVGGWRTRTPAEFRFVLKGWRAITHVHRLRDCASLLEAFFSRFAPLRHRVLAVLWQLPPGMVADVTRLAAFLADLRRAARGYRHAFEFRDASWFADPVFETLGRHHAAVVAADWPFQVLLPGMRAADRNLPVARAPHTAEWVYLRRHGPREAYRGDYSPAMIRTDAMRIRRWLDEGRDALCFYNNDLGGAAVRDALCLRTLVVRRRG